MDNQKSFPAVFLLGALAGGVAALLLAPRSGQETRRKLRDGTKGLYDKGERKALEARDAARDKASSVTGAARVQVGAVKEAFSEGKVAYKEELKKQRETVSSR